MRPAVRSAVFTTVGLRPGYCIAAICVVALAVRLLLAPHFAHGDVGVIEAWARSAVRFGIGQSYRQQIEGSSRLPRYPPVSILMFGTIAHAFYTVRPAYPRDAPLPRTVIKLPAILADLVMTLGMFAFFRRWSSPAAGVTVAAAYAFHPAVIYDSAVWGQTDAVFTTLAVLALMAWLRHRPYLAGALLMLAVLAKLQAVVMVPLFLALAAARCRASPRFLIGAASAAVVVGAICWGHLDQIWHICAESIGYRPVLSANAYNVWWTLYGEQARSIRDDGSLFGPVSYRALGMLLWFVSSGLAIFAVRHALRASDELHQLLVFIAAACVAYAFFLFNTEMHERYLFPFMTVGLPLILLGKTATALYGIASLLFLLNLLGVLSFGPIHGMLSSALGDAPRLAVGMTHLVVFAGLMTFLVRAAAERTAD